MVFGKPLEFAHSKIGYVLKIVSFYFVEHIITIAICGFYGIMFCSNRIELFACKRWWRKTLIGKHINRIRMINGDEFSLVEINCFPKFFSYFNGIFAIFWFNVITGNKQVFFGCIGESISGIFSINGQRHAECAAPHHIFYKLIPLSIPGIQERTGAFEHLLFDYSFTG